MPISCDRFADECDPDDEHDLGPQGPDDDLDELADRLAAQAPRSRTELAELEAGLEFLSATLDDDAREIVGRVVEALVERHRAVIRHVVRAVISMHAGPTSFAEIEDVL